MATAPWSPFSLSSVLNWICWTPPPEQNSWVRHWFCNKTTYVRIRFWTGNDRRQDQCLFCLEFCLRFNWNGNYSISIKGHRVFSCIPHSDQATDLMRLDRRWDPASLLLKGHRRALSPAERRPKREEDKLPLSSTEVKNEWMYISTPFHAFTT